MVVISMIISQGSHVCELIALSKSTGLLACLLRHDEHANKPYRCHLKHQSVASSVSHQCPSPTPFGKIWAKPRWATPITSTHYPSPIAHCPSPIAHFPHQQLGCLPRCHCPCKITDMGGNAHTDCLFTHLKMGRVDNPDLSTWRQTD